MEPTILTAAAAALGSLVGGAASIATTWISQSTERAHANAEWKLRERETLYKEFITEASRLTIDAIMHSMERPDQIMMLYGVLSRIRLVSGKDVVCQAEACCRRVIEMYGRPNLTTDDLRRMVADNRVEELDSLKAFSNTCRTELLGVEA